MTSECFMCDISSGVDTGRWYDAVLRRTDDAIVIPALGAITPGHVLVVPPGHTRSVQLLPGDVRTRFVSALEDVMAFLGAETRTGVTVFEHGAAFAGSGPRSACSEHAHVQVVPGRFEASGTLHPRRRYPSLAAFYSAEAPFDPYLMISDPGDEVVVSADVGISQYFRRAMLTERGEPDSWDYWVFPRHENVAATIDFFAAR